MRHLFAIPVILLAMLTCGLAGQTKEWSSDDAGISFQIPDDPAWLQATPPKPQVKLLMERADKTADIFFAIYEAPPDGKTLDQFVKGFEGGYWREPAVKRTGEYIVFKGQHAYQTSGDLTVNGALIKKGAIVWVAGGKVLLISVMKRGLDPFEDPTVKAFLDSTKISSKSAK
jgi:hypothetical protein